MPGHKRLVLDNAFNIWYVKREHYRGYAGPARKEFNYSNLNRPIEILMRGYITYLYRGK